MYILQVHVCIQIRSASLPATANLYRGRDKEKLLLETQFLAILSSIVGVQHRADVLSLALLIYCLQITRCIMTLYLQQILLHQKAD